MLAFPRKKEKEKRKKDKNTQFHDVRAGKSISTSPVATEYLHG